MVYLKTEQVLLPRQVYIGDRAEIRCTFETDSPGIRNEIAQKGVIELSTECFAGERNLSLYDIKKVTIESGSYNKYTLVVTFNAWHTGKIQLPDYDIGYAINADRETYLVKFNPVEIVSITQEESISTIRDMHSPLLLPGTTYKLYAAAISLVLFIILLIRVIVKRQKVSFFFKNRILMWRYNKNKKQTIRALTKLKQNSKLLDSEVSMRIQNILRAYLEFRFDYPFTKKVSSEILMGFYEATNSMISEKKLPACEYITQVFIRTDYIRYSKDSSFERGEKDDLITNLLQAIEVLETEEVIIPEMEETNA
ncbi:MAG: hypothetical protein J6X54_04815 [Treponema sp.]|nr:hypothetical protein [Treponema sp.]